MMMVSGMGPAGKNPSHLNRHELPNSAVQRAGGLALLALRPLIASVRRHGYASAGRHDQRPVRQESAMTIKQVGVAVLLVALVFPVATGRAAERECDRWLKLVEGELRERKEALEKARGTARQRIQEVVSRAADPAAEARKSCAAGHDKAATLRALELWDAFVEEERQDGSLSLNSRLTILALRADRLKAFQQRGWKAKVSSEAQQSFVAELDRLDRVLADALKQALR